MLQKAMYVAGIWRDGLSTWQFCIHVIFGGVYLWNMFLLLCCHVWGRWEVFMGKVEEKRQMRKVRRIWEDNIKIDLQEV